MKTMGFPDTLVISAIEQGATAELERLLNTGGASAKAAKADGVTAMHVAASLNNVPAMEVLLRHGGSLHDLDGSGNSPLLTAAGAGQLEAAKFLLGTGASANVRNKQTETALHLAAKGGYADVVAYFGAAAKYMIDFTTSDGRTAVMLAAEKNNAVSIEALIGAGANLFLRDDGKRTAMDWAVLKGSRAAEDMLALYHAGNPMRHGLNTSIEAPEPARFRKKPHPAQAAP